MNTHAYFKSLAAEITAVKDRVQILIGGSHWPSVGAWKESVLRSILRRHLPPSMQIGTGFIMCKEGISTQIDILIYDDSAPILFRDGDLVIVTPDVVRAVIEVKTRIQSSQLEKIVKKLNEIMLLVRLNPIHPAPFFGIYSYEEEPLGDALILEKLQKCNGDFGTYAIQCLSIGTSQFVRYWQFPPVGHARRFSHWHCYKVDGIAQAYFVHNVVGHLFPESVLANSELWYPINGKESSLVACKPRNAGEEPQSCCTDS